MKKLILIPFLALILGGCSAQAHYSSEPITKGKASETKVVIIEGHKFLETKNWVLNWSPDGKWGYYQYFYTPVGK